MSETVPDEELVEDMKMRIRRGLDVMIQMAEMNNGPETVLPDRLGIDQTRVKQIGQEECQRLVETELMEKLGIQPEQLEERKVDSYPFYSFQGPAIINVYMTARKYEERPMYLQEVVFPEDQNRIWRIGMAMRQ